MTVSFGRASCDKRGGASDRNGAQRKPGNQALHEILHGGLAHDMRYAAEKNL